MSTVTMVSANATRDFAQMLFPSKENRYEVKLFIDPSKLEGEVNRLELLIEMLRKKDFTCEASEYKKLMKIPKDNFEITFQCFGWNFKGAQTWNRAVIYFHFVPDTGCISKIETTPIEWAT